MPHKHRRVDDDESQFNLPPTAHAAALPVGKARAFSFAPRVKKRKTNHVQGYGADDTPKAFQRLMALSKSSVKKPSGLDDGVVKSNKQRKAEQNAAKKSSERQPAPPVPPADSNTPQLKILPGESLSAFRVRVDAALPLNSVPRHTKRIQSLSDHRVTKHERRLKRLQKGWREEEARIREKEAEERELAEEENDDVDALWQDNGVNRSDRGVVSGGKKGKKGKRKKRVGEIDHDDSDDWAALSRSRESRKGLHDVVSAPPTFDRVPREIFKVKNGAGAKVGDVPNKVGSLRKREEVGEERKTIIETYRELMAAKRAQS